MMGFNPTFYAGRPKLSEVTIDSDLDMGGRNITASLVRARQIHAPIVTEDWPVEALAWDDGTEQIVAERTDDYPYGGLTTELITADEVMEITVKIVATAGQRVAAGAAIKVDGVTADTTDVILSPNPAWSQEYTSKPIVLNPGSLVTFTAATVPTGSTTKLHCIVTNTGREVGEKTFDLTGKWLALGLDMKGLAATVKIQGVEMSYSDYAKYFPLAPSELKIPGNWSPTQIRPIVEVYS